MKDQSYSIVTGENKPAFFWRHGRFKLQIVLLLVLCAQTAMGLTFTMTDIGSTPMTVEQLDAFQQAAAIWESIFSDPVTINFNISFEDMPAGKLGSTGSGRTTHSYASVRAALLADAAGYELAAVNSLPISSLPVTDINGDRFADLVTITTANAKALGLGTGLEPYYASVNPPAGIDAEIRFSTSFAAIFDYDPSDGITPGKIDFVGLATHEIGHALGFVSVIDPQDFNPGYVFHPSTLDFYRYLETGPSTTHSMTTERRRTTAGAAEYYDLSPNNVPFSHGTADFSDPLCNSGSGSCQASHWSDDQGLLMDPTLSRGVLNAIKPEDSHAFDFIGWNKKFLLLEVHRIRMLKIGWFYIHELPDIPIFGGAFDDSPSPPDADSIQWAANGTLGLRAAFDLGYDGGKRSGLGYATFLPAVQIDPVTFDPPPVADEQQDLYPLAEVPATEIPANLRQVFIQSDMEGVPFSFKSACGENGCPFDPSLGDFGGYRIPGIIDGQGDQQAGDADGMITMILFTPDASGAPDPTKYNIFENNKESEDNNIIILDPEAIGAVLPAVCGDVNHPIPLASLNGDCFVNVIDLALFGQEWLLCTDPVCP